MIGFRGRNPGAAESERDKLKRQVSASAHNLNVLLSQDCPLASVLSEAFNDLMVRFDHLVRYVELNPLPQVQEAKQKYRPSQDRY